MAQSKQKRRPPLSDWESVFFHTLEDGTVLMADKVTSSTSEGRRFTVLYVRGSASAVTLDYLYTLYHTFFDTPEPPTCSSKASPSGKPQTP